MFSNALIRRYRYSLLRPRQLWIYLTIYITLVGVLFFINYTAYQNQELFDTLTDLYRSLYYQFLLLQFLILCIWGASNSFSSIKEEIIGNTYDFFRMLPLAAYKKTIGLLIGKNLLALLLGVINCGLLLFFGFAGKINATLQVQLLIMLVSIALLANTTALLMSICRGKKRKRGSWLGLIFLAVFITPYLICAVVQLARIKTPESHRICFFNLKIPVLLLISYISVYFSLWIIAGIIHKFNRENEPLFNRWAGPVFLMGYHIITVGLFYKYLTGSFLSHWPTTRILLNYSCWLTLLAPVLLIPFGFLKNYDSYLEYSGQILSKAKVKNKGFWRIAAFSNITWCVLLFVLWIISVATTLFIQIKRIEISHPQLINCLHFIFVLFSFYLFLLLLMELFVLYSPVYNKINLLLVFIVLLQLFLPLILSVIMNNEDVILYSPLGFIVSNLHESEKITTSTALYIFLANITLCMIPAGLILKRYFNLINIRKKM